MSEAKAKDSTPLRNWLTSPSSDDLEMSLDELRIQIEYLCEALEVLQVITAQGDTANPPHPKLICNQVEFLATMMQDRLSLAERCHENVSRALASRKEAA